MMREVLILSILDSLKLSRENGNNKESNNAID